MKKIININLSGRVIPIEDSAYEKLQAYIESLRRYFSNEEGRDEIINDIESRIAELMSEVIRKGNSAVTDEDVNQIISSMGRVEDFEAVEAEDGGSGAGGPAMEENFKSSRRERGRLYRDSSDKIIGGVCSGIANYLNIDPAIVRILFAIISFGGGIGFIAYILLWIILPPRDLDDYNGKRLYRNPDDRVIGGVAGGLAAYFGKSSSTIRLIFAAPILLNVLFGILSWPAFHEGSLVPNIVFGSLTGTFIFIYIVLWIVLPEANSEYQKMEMRGEKVDVNRIRQNVKEGMDSMKDRMKGFSKEVKDSAKNISGRAKEFASTKGRTFVGEAGQAARRTGRGIGHIIGVLFKAFFLFIAGTIAFALFVGLIGILIGGVSIWPLKNFLLDGFWQNAYGWGTLILFLGIPLIGFIVWLLRRIMRVRSHNNYLGWTFGGLWAIGWVCATLFVASIVNDFRMSNYRSAATEMPITQPLNGKLIVKVSEPELEYSGSFPWLDIDGEGIDITNDSLRTANIRIDDIIASEDGNYHVQLKKYSCGRTMADAETRAEKIQFHASFADSVLDLGSSIAIDKESKFRGQQVIIIISVPKGKRIRFDSSVDKLHAFNIRINRRHRWEGRSWDEFDGAFSYQKNVDYVMGTDGQLKDEKGAPATRIDNNYRYPVADSIDQKQEDQRIKQEQIDEEKRKIKESEQRIKDIQGQPTTKRKAIPEKTTGTFAMGPSPVSSLTEWF
jgi:phage shock protein PspC (stress-responsive transcriptional regulator)